MLSPALGLLLLLSTLPASPPAPRERLSETYHKIQLEGAEVSYRALAGELLLRDEAEKPQALMFYVAYLATGASGARPAERPITFLFNGGPGSAAVWLHLGAFGPKRLRLDAQGFPGPPPYGVTDNPVSLLDLTDLVFIDPVSTGYSRALPGVKGEIFHEVHADIESVSEFIRRFLTRQKRWDSPLFIAGESYGTIRGAGLVDELLRRHGVSCRGLVLISPALNQTAFREGDGNDLPYILALPSYAATAWYHHRLEPALQAKGLEAVLREAEELALGPYARALLLGAGLGAEEQKAIVGQLARLTGLPPEEIARRDLRVSREDFAAELLRADRLQLGLLDSRSKGSPNPPGAQSAAAALQAALFDPADEAVSGAFVAALQQYLRRELLYDSESSYEALSLPVAQGWDYSRVPNRHLYGADSLRSALNANPDLDVFVANGHYDLVTTSLAARYVIDHLGIDPSLRDNFTLAFYPAGHMMYLHEPSHRQLKEDLARFYRAALMRK